MILDGEGKALKSGIVIKRISYVLLAGILLSALWVCSLFFGDPVSKFIAGKNVRSYLAENYRAIILE